MANILKAIERAIMRPMSKVMPPCSEISQLLSTGMDQKMSLWQRMSVRVHLVLCKMCRRYRDQLRLIHDASSCYGDPEKNDTEEGLSTEAKERLKQAIDGK